MAQGQVQYKGQGLLMLAVLSSEVSGLPLCLAGFSNISTELGFLASALWIHGTGQVMTVLCTAGD